MPATAKLILLGLAAVFLLAVVFLYSDYILLGLFVALVCWFLTPTGRPPGGRGCGRR